MENAEVLKSLYAAFAVGDVPTVLGGMDPAIEWHEAEGNPYLPADGSPFTGPEAILNGLFIRLATEWDAFTVTPAQFSALGNRVLVEGRYTGTFKATGRAIDAPFAHVWTMSDSKVTAFQQYTDTAAMRDSMGA